MISVSGIDWSKVTKAGEIAPPKFAPKGVTTFMQPPKQSVNLKKFMPQVAPKEEYISPYMELNKPISPEQKQVVMALGANIKKGDDLATIRQKFPEIADIGDKSLQALRANIMKGDSPEMIEKKFPELQWIKTKQTDDKYKYNIMNKPTQFLQGLREKAENINIPVVEPLAKGVLGTAMLGTKGMRDVIQGGAGLLDKGIAGATGTDKVYKSGVAEDVFDVAQGSSNTLASVVAPVSVTALGTVMSALPKPVQQSVGDIFQNIGGFIAKTPGLKQWKESLPPERRAEFDNEVMGGLTALFLGAKNKGNLLKNPKAFVQENILNPQNVLKNIEQNVLNVPGRIKNIPTGARNTADWVISTELPRGKWRDKFYKMTGKTPEKYIGDMGVKGLDAEGLAKLEESRDFAKGQADEGLSEIKGNYRYRPIEYTKSDGTKVEYVGDAIRDMLEDIIDKKPKNTTEVDKYREYLRKYDEEGLSQTEINTAKREFERSNRFNYLRENNIDRYNRATNVDSAVREWQYKVAESRGLDLRSVNKQTQAIKTLIDKLGGDATEMKGFNLSDWLIAGNMTPEAIALLVGKKIADSKYIKNKIVSALNIGRKTGLKKINKSALEASQRKVDIERYLYDKFGKNDVPSSDTYGLPVRSNNRLGLPRQVESPTNVYKPRTDVVTPTGKVIPSKFKRVIEMGEATQPGTTKLEGQENMPKTLPNTNLPKKMPTEGIQTAEVPKMLNKGLPVKEIMGRIKAKKLPDGKYKLVYIGTNNAVEIGGKPITELFDNPKQARGYYEAMWYKNQQPKSPKPQEKQAVIEGEKVPADLLQEARKYKSAEEFMNGLKEQAKSANTIPIEINFIDLYGKYDTDFRKLYSKTRVMRKGLEGKEIISEISRLKDIDTKFFEKAKEQLKKIREQANKKGLPVKETQPTKQVPEAKNIEEDLLAEARKYKSAEEFIKANTLKKMREYVKNDLFTDWRFKDGDYIKTHIANKDIGDYIKKGDAVTLSLDKGPQGVKVMVMFDPVTDGGFVHKRVFNVNKDDFTSIREQANKNRIIK